MSEFNLKHKFTVYINSHTLNFIALEYRGDLLLCYFVLTTKNFQTKLTSTLQRRWTQTLKFEKKSISKLQFIKTHSRKKKWNWNLKKNNSKLTKAIVAPCEPTTCRLMSIILLWFSLAFFLLRIVFVFWCRKFYFYMVDNFFLLYVDSVNVYLNNAKRR